MGDFTVLNEEQIGWVMECDMDPERFVVIHDNERTLTLLHLKSRNEVMICKNRRVKRGN